MTYDVTLDRVDAQDSTAYCKSASLAVDSALAGRADAFNPAELLLAALGACMLKNIERVAPILKFEFRAVPISLQGERQDTPPKMQRVQYWIGIDTDESDHRLDLLHRNVQKYGTVFNTIAENAELIGRIERRLSSDSRTTGNPL